MTGYWNGGIILEKRLRLQEKLSTDVFRGGNKPVKRRRIFIEKAVIVTGKQVLSDSVLDNAHIHHHAVTVDHRSVKDKICYEVMAMSPASLRFLTEIVKILLFGPGFLPKAVRCRQFESLANSQVHFGYLMRLKNSLRVDGSS